MSGRPRRDDLALVNRAAMLWEADEPELGWLARVFTQLGLPYRDPGEDVPLWQRRNGRVWLTVQPRVTNGADGRPRWLHPFGVVPRLLLVWVCTEAVRRREPDLVLGDSLTDFMRQLGLTRPAASPTGGRTGSIGRLLRQMDRLLGASITVHVDGPEHASVAGWRIASSYSIWWGGKADDPRQGALMPSSVRLSADFYREVIEHPIPLPLDRLQLVKSSPMALDLLVWLVARLWRLRQPTEVPWSALRVQFGTTSADTKQGRHRFRRELEGNLRRALLAYPDARVAPCSGGLLLLPSPPLVVSRLALR